MDATYTFTSMAVPYITPMPATSAATSRPLPPGAADQKSPYLDDEERTAPRPLVRARTNGAHS